MKVRITKETLRRYSRDFYYWKDFPDFIILEGAKVEECEHKHQIKLNGNWVCEDCKQRVPSLPELPEEIDFHETLNPNLRIIAEEHNKLIRYLKSRE